MWSQSRERPWQVIQSRPLGRTVSRICWQIAGSCFPKINKKEQTSTFLGSWVKRLIYDSIQKSHLFTIGFKSQRMSLFLPPSYDRPVLLPLGHLSCALGRKKLQNKSYAKHNTCSAHKQCRASIGSKTSQATYPWNFSLEALLYYMASHQTVQVINYLQN